MFRWALRKEIDKFERESTCDASYIRDEIDASPCAAWLIGMALSGLALARSRRTA